jgi:hypothetical protein
MNDDLKKQLSVLTMLWGAVSAGYLFILLTMYLVLKQVGSPVTNSPAFTLISIFSIFTLIPAAFYSYSWQSKKAKSAAACENRFLLYRKAWILKIAMSEAAGMIPIVAYFVTANQQFIMLAAISLIVLLISKPSEEQYRKDFDDSGFSDEQNIR